MIKAFRIISYLEGISYIILLGIGVPLKYIDFSFVEKTDAVVKSVGMPHGILFVAYIFLAIAVGRKLNWNTKTHIIVLIASIIPFGTFYIDKKYLSDSQSL